MSKAVAFAGFALFFRRLTPQKYCSTTFGTGSKYLPLLQLFIPACYADRSKKLVRPINKIKISPIQRFGDMSDEITRFLQISYGVLAANPSGSYSSPGSTYLSLHS
jgi:hypothetical protein